MSVFQNFINEMSKEYEVAKANPEKLYMVVIVELPNAPMAEVIINPRPNFESKAKYYMEMYDDMGCLQANPKVKIVAFQFVNDLEEANEFIYNFS